MVITYHPQFIKEYKKLPINIQELAEMKEMLFLENPFDSRLRTHRLHGDLKGYWAFSVNHQYRIIFEFRENDGVRFYTIGKHDIY